MKFEIDELQITFDKVRLEKVFKALSFMKSNYLNYVNIY